MSFLLPGPPQPPKAGGLARPASNFGRALPDRPDPLHDGPPTARINVKAAIFLGVLALLAVILYFPLSAIQENRLRRAALAQAREFAEAKKVDLALLTLAHHIESWPEDLEALELQAKLLTETARAPDEILKAAGVQDQVLRIDPMGKGRQDNRRELVELYLRYGEILRYTSTKRELWIDRFESRYRAAVKIANQRIVFGADDAASHRLMAIALEGLAAMGDAKSLSDASIEYEKALRRDPTDTVSAERLALIDLERKNSYTAGDEILDELLRASPESAKARLVRYRYYRRTERDPKAAAELAAATRLAPTDVEVRLTAAADALNRGDVAAARRHVAAITPEDRKDARVTALRGQIEMVEGHADEAIEIWRKGLSEAVGLNRELNWQLANALIRQGRLDEARPLVARFEKLAGDPTNPISCMLRGMLKERAGQPVAAIAELEAARPFVGKEVIPDLAMALGRCYESLNEDLKAMVEFRRAQDLSPVSSSPRRAAARILRKTDPEAAARSLEEAVKVVTDPGPAILDLALIRFAQQRALPPEKRNWGEVEALLDRVVQALPNALDHFKLRAEFLAATGRGEAAFALLEQTARGAGRARDDAWLAWAGALSNQGRDDEALRVLEEASAPSAAGDHATLRAARARLLARSGRARAARDLLTLGQDRLPAHERAALARSRAEILQELGDHPGARAACLEWARLSPGDPQPGLTLLAMAQRGGGDESARLGLDLLAKTGGQDEPYSLAARALDLMLSNRAREETRTARQEQADHLVESLQSLAPQLPISHLLRGMMMERNHRLEDAVNSYRTALRGNARAMALPRLVALYTRLNRQADLNDLRESTGQPALIDQLSAAASLEAGDKDQAERLVAQLVENQPDSLEMRATQVRLLGEMGKPKEAEEAIRDLAKRRPDQPGPWLALVVLQLGQKQPAEAAKTIEMIASSYKGERPDLLLARCRWAAGQKAAAEGLLDDALAARPSDLATMKEAEEFFRANGKLERSEAILRQALKVEPTSPWATRRLALLLADRPGLAAWSEAWALIVSAGGESPDDRMARATVLARSPDPARRAEAGPALLALAEDLPVNNPVGVDARARLARDLLDANRPAEAAALLAPAVDETATPGPVALGLATEALARSGKPAEAGRQLARLAAIEPNSPRSVACRAWTFHAAGRQADAAATVEAAMSESEGKPEEEIAGLAYFDLLLKIGQPDSAERLALRIVSRRPRAAWMLGIIQAGRGKVAEALASARSAVEAGATREPLKLIMGMINANQLGPAELAEAGKLADKALAKASSDLPTIGLVAGVRHFQGRYEDELALHLKNLEIDPTNTVYLNDMAWILSECLGRPAEGLERVDEAIKRGGRLPQFADTRGVILTRLGRHDEAIAELSEAVKLNPSGPFYYHLARAYRKAGRADLHRKYRELARSAGVDPSRLDLPERAEFAAIMAP